MVLTAENAINAQVGDLVILQSQSGPVLKAAALLYMLPLLLFFIGYLLGAVMWASGGPVGCAAFVLGLILSIIYDRKVLKKRKTVYVISEFAQMDTKDF